MQKPPVAIQSWQPQPSAESHEKSLSPIKIFSFTTLLVERDAR